MPSDYVTTPGKFEATLRSMTRDVARQMVAAGKRAVHLAALDGQKHVVEVIGTIKPFQPVDTGEMRRSYQVRMERHGHVWTAVLENVAPHAAHMEFGTRPHWAPLEPLIRWAERKLRKAKPRKQRTSQGAGVGASSAGSRTKTAPTETTKGPSKAAQKRLSLARDWAVRVRFKIAQEGTEPREFHAKASRRFPLFMKARLITELAKVK